MLQLELSNEERNALSQIVKMHEKSYMRERASAILQISLGKSGLEVAKSGLLQKRRENTVYEWVKRYKAEGLSGLFNRKGRGRKPSFFSIKSGTSQDSFTCKGQPISRNVSAQPE